jgi:GNAT superfamily N-acetyltransferase
VTSLSTVVLLDGTHDVSQFSCGKREMDTWLQRHALTNQRLNASRTYVTCEGAILRGYFSLAPSSIEFRDAPPRVRKRLARYPVPVILLARLAVDERVQRMRVGESLLLNALQRSLEASRAIGGVAVLVHALDADARDFYEKYDFERSPTHAFHLLLRMSDIAATLTK